jgi:cyclomaltodextrinase
MRNLATHSILGSSLRLTLLFLCCFLQATPTFAQAPMPSAWSTSTIHVPEWAKRVVWYQIFPERFRNGDTSNDPRARDLQGSWPHQIDEGWQASRWTADWYELQPWEQNDAKGFYFHVQQRRYGGDIKGIMEKLDYLKSMGIGAIYLNPMFESPSLHKYDARFYHHIDKNFGPDPEGDRKLWAEEDPSDPATWKWTAADRLFLEFVKEAHKRKLKVILDGVFNHVGMTFWAFEDIKKNQQSSRFKDWFTIKRWDDPATPSNEFDYEGWSGVRELPELREDENGIVRGPREYIAASVRRWMDPNGDGNPEDGVDGWRLDVAEKVNIVFWREFRSWVRAINPEAYIVGEVWWEDWNNDKMFNAVPWLQGDTFDAVMNYRWGREAFRYFAASSTKISSSVFIRRLQGLLEDYPKDVNHVLMNLYDSHDTDRLSSHIINKDLSFDKRVGLSDNHEYDIRKPTIDEYATQKLMVLFQMTALGAPMVYYGDEVGMWGGDDPDCRKPMLWSDLQYDDERSHPFGTKRPVDRNRPDMDLFQWYVKAIQLRNDHTALQVGGCDFLPVDDRKDIVAFVRHDGTESVLVILNNSVNEQTLSLPLPVQFQNKVWKDLLFGKESRAANEVFHANLGRKSGSVFGSAR